MSLWKTTRHTAKNPAVLIAAAAGILLAAALAAFILHQGSQTTSPVPVLQEDDGKMAEDLLRLSAETYSAALLSMHSTANFKEEAFLRYRGLDTLVAAHAIRSTGELSQYLECILSSGNPVSDLYICPDPELLWAAAGETAKVWKDSLKQDFCSYIEAHPQIAFSLLLPYPCLDYWLESETAELDTALTLYHNLINELRVYPNVRIFFPGAQEWLILNPDNYTDTCFDTNEVITESLLCHVFCDGDYAVTPENEADIWQSLRETIAREKASPTRHADLSDYCLVFFGDSVLGNYPGSFSIPGYITGLSDASSFNFAVSGTSASSMETVSRPDFPDIIGDFLAENTAPAENGCQFTPESTSPEELEGRKLCFLISYGFNDYFDGATVENPLDPYDIHSFKGGLRTCIARLQEAFPDAAYILMTPTRTSAFDFGTDRRSENGGCFLDYINAVKEIAAETGACLIDNYTAFTITEENLDTYLADGIHPNETGRLTIACRIIDFIENEFPDQPAIK